MREHLKHYIDGQWVESQGGRRYEVINPATEEACTAITLGSEADVDKAVAAAKRAFASYSQTSLEERTQASAIWLARSKRSTALNGKKRSPAPTHASFMNRSAWLPRSRRGTGR